MSCKCPECGEEFGTAEELRFHRESVRHCPTCKDAAEGGERWTTTNWAQECRLCTAERAFKEAAEREGDSTYWH